MTTISKSEAKNLHNSKNPGIRTEALKKLLRKRNLEIKHLKEKLRKIESCECGGTGWINPAKYGLAQKRCGCPGVKKQ